MKSDVPLDYAIFHLTPTRTRCELLVASGNEKERLASGLIKPFLMHLKAVEDQISNGCCSSSITLQPPPITTCSDTPANASSKTPYPPHTHDAAWFTKGTVERFVRFVSTPEVLELVSSVDDELTQIEEAISMQAMESSSSLSQGIEASLSMATPSSASNMSLSLSFDKAGTTLKSRHNSLDGGVDVLELPESSKWQSARGMEARRLALHKEQGMAFARAAAAGFDVQHMPHLLAFADCFGAIRLRYACVKFIALCQKRQEACKCIEEMECAAIISARLSLLVSASPDGSLVRPSRDQYADRQSEIHGNLHVSEASKDDDISSRSHSSLFNDGQAFVDDHDTDAHGQASSQHHRHHQHRRAPFDVLHGASTATVTTNGDYLSHGCSAHYHSSTSMDYNQDNVFLEQSYAEDAVPLCQNGGGLIWSPVALQCTSPQLQLQMHSHSSRFMVDAAGETCIDLGVSHHRQGRRRSWARHSASHIFPALFSSSSQSAYSSSSRNSHLYNPDSDYIYPLESCKHNSLWNSQFGPHLNEEGSGCVNGNGSLSDVQNFLSPTTLASDQNWQPSPRHPSVSGISHGHAQDQQNTQGGGFCRHITTHMQRKNAVGMDAPCRSTVSKVITEITGYETLEHESREPSKFDTTAVASNSNLSRCLIPALPLPKQKTLSAVQQPMPASCSSRVQQQQQHPANVVPRSINYMSSDSGWSSAERLTGKDFQDGGIMDDSDHSLTKKQDVDDNCHSEAPCRSLSVKDAISLFEVKRVNVTEDFKKKLPKQQEPHRGSSTGTPRTPSFVFEKPVLRRWNQVGASNNSDCSHMETEQQSKDVRRSSPEDSCPQYCTATIDILREPHQATDSFCTGLKTVVSEASMMAAGMHGEFSRMPLDSVLPPDSLAKYSATRPGLLCSSGPNNVLSSFYREAHAEEGSVATVESEGAKNMTVVKDKELVQPEHPSLMSDAFNATVASRACAEDNSSNQLRTGIQLEVELPDDEQRSSLLKESNPTSEHNTSILPASDTDDGSLAMNSAANQKSISELHHDNNADVKHVVSVVKGEMLSPQERKGRFYEHYRERRDAKFREEPGSKRAEREAKLKAMQEVLEKRKEEMAARNNNSGKLPEKLHSASADAHLHGDKLHNFKPEVAISRKSKEGEDKLVDEMRVRQHERPAVASRSSPTLTASLTSRAAASQRQQLSSPKQNVVQKLSSPQKFSSGNLSLHANTNLMSPAAASGIPKLSSRAALQRQSATAPNSTMSGEIPLSHSSVPCVAELRKENTKPLAVRSSTLHERRPVNKTISGPVLRSYTAPLEANRSQPAAVVSFNIYKDKKSRNSGMRSLSLVSTDLLQDAPPLVSQMPLKISKYVMVEQNAANKPTKHMAAACCQATPDAKPFLRKGRGIGPGAGAAGVRKSKVVPGSLDPAKFLDEDVAIVTSLPSKDSADSADLSTDALKSQHYSTTQVAVDECNKQTAVETSIVTCCNDPIHPPLQFPNAPPVAKSNSLIELTQDMLQEGDHVTETDQVSPAAFEVHTEDYSNVYHPLPASYTGSSQEVEPGLLDALHEVSTICTSPALDEASKNSSSPGMHQFLQANNPPSASSPPTSTSCVSISPSNAPEAPVVDTVADKASVASPPPHIQSSPPHLPMFTSSPRATFCQRESYDTSWVLAASATRSPSGLKHDDGVDDELPHSSVPNSPPVCEAHSSSLAEDEVSSHSASPLVSQSVPPLEASLSPEASLSSHGTTAAARSRRKWGSAEKVPPPIIMMSKESPKGIRKLLKFGRKSRSGCSFSSSPVNDWHETASTTTTTATTASDADDADLELNNRMSFSNLTKRLERSWKNGGKTQLLLHKGIRSISALRQSSASSPSSKTVDGAAARSINYAPRSFFSLSTFRSRSNESKSRS